MGCHDEICLICCNSPSGGPNSLTWNGSIEEDSAKLASEILAARPGINIDLDELTSIVAAPLQLDWGQHGELGLPQFEGVKGLWAGGWASMHEAVLIGHWKEGDSVCEWEETMEWDDDGIPYYNNVCRFATGLDVAVLPGVSPDGSSFYCVEEDKTCAFHPDYGQKSTTITLRNLYTGVFNRTGEDNPTVTLSACCFHYLQHWVDFQKLPPPRVVHSGGALSVPGEFYEIVNSRREVKQDTLPCIDYDGIDRTLQQYQSHFENARKGVEHVAQAVSMGLRGADLIPALREDFRCWAFMRTDIWPLPSVADTVDSLPSSVGRTASQKRAQLDSLPDDILFDIMGRITMTSFLALAATCRTLRARFLGQHFVNSVFKHYVYAGPLRWILPVPVVDQEEKHARAAATQWLTHVGATFDEWDEDSSPFDAPEFPYYQFIRACHRWDCTKNRRRIWGIIKQFERLWLDYRLHGWEVDRFIKDKD